MVATAIVLLEYISIALLVMQSVGDKNVPKKSMHFKLMHLLFWIYNAYIFYYVFINPKMPLEIMYQVPVEKFSMIQSMVTTSLLITVVTSYQHYLNVKWFTKVAAAFMILVLLVYTLTADMSMYLYKRTLSGLEYDKFDLSEYGLIDTLIMSEFVQIAFIFNFFARHTWSRKENVNRLLFWMTSGLLLFLLLIYGQRGPIVWLVTTLLFYYYAKGRLRKTVVVSVVLVMAVAALFGDTLLGLFSKYDITLLERFIQIGEDGGSGRVGDVNSVYNSASRQIINGLLFGSYFRLTVGGYVGNYPHNFVLEYLMTFGLVFSIPLFWLICKGVKKCYYAVKVDAPLSVFCIIFLNTYLCHLTSFTVVNDSKMWVLLAMTLCIGKGSVGKTNRRIKR